MNASPTTAIARGIAIVLILAVAAVAGLATATLIRDVRDGGRTAEAAFSLAALDDLHALRAGEAASVETAPEPWVDYGVRLIQAAAEDEYVDYGVRHGSAPADEDEYVDYGVRHGSAPADDDEVVLRRRSR